MADREQLARVLGWASLGLGLAAGLAPKRVGQLIGVRDDNGARPWLIAVGMRENVCGIGILTQSKPTGWLWARVAGDMMDIALLTTTFMTNKAQRNRVVGALAAVLGLTVLDVTTSMQLSR